MEECNIKQFLDNPDYWTLFNSSRIFDDEDIVKHIEDYHILPRDILVDKINKVIGEETVTIAKKEELNRFSSLRCFEDKYDIVIHVINAQSILVYYDIFKYDNLDEDSLKLDLAEFSNVIIRAITPGNLRELQGKRIDDDYYDYDFMLKTLVIDCVEKGATDLHINTRHKNMKPYYTIDYRRDNHMWRNTNWRMNGAMIKKLVYRTIARKTEANENDLLLSGVEASIKDLLGDGKYELRVAAIGVLQGYKSAIRIQKLKTISMKINELGFDMPVQKELEFLSKKYTGLTLITGPIRSGKNTTAFAMTNDMDLDKYSIMDISSPVEVRMDFPQVDYGGGPAELLATLKKCKKLDLDLAVINEIPSKEVAFGVRDLINSSVGVITTTHLDRIWHIPHKLKDYYGEDYKDVLSQINAVINQKMYVKQCPHCASKVLVDTVPPKIRDYLKSYDVQSVYINEGCSKCNDGRLLGGIQPYAEVLVFTPEVKEELRKCKEAYEMEAIIKNLMTKDKASLDYKVCDAIQSGLLHYSEAYTLV